MSDKLTPERIAELRAEILRLNAKLGDAQMIAAHNHSVAEATRVERDAEADRLVERGRLMEEASRQRIAALEAGRDAALAEVARLKKDLQELSSCTQYLREQLESRHKSGSEHLAENARLRDLLARVQVEDRWRPIETAPKDGTLIVGWDQRILRGKGLPRLMLWGDNLSTGKKGWMPIEIVVEFQPTHWRPLPLTPAEEAELDALRKAVALEGETP